MEESPILKLEQVKQQRDWVREINQLSLLIDKLEEMGKVTSVRELAKLLEKSKSWVAVSLLLVKGLRLYPEIEKLHSRNNAYEFLLKKNKLRRILES